MNSRNRPFELWTVGSKTIVLIYVIYGTYFNLKHAGGWYIFAYLLYISLSCGLLIPRKRALSQALVLLSILFLAMCSKALSPQFLLLLPISLYELISLWMKNRLSFLLLLVPLLFVPASLLALYLLIAGISVLGFIVIRHYDEKLDMQMSQSELMRADLQRLTRTLNENKEYLKQSEYTIKLEERNRLSQRIHDEIGHSMAGALIQMEASKRLLASNPDKAAELLGNAIAISKEGLEQIRHTLKNIKPRSEELGINRLRLFVDELASKHSMTATLTHEGDLDVITPIQWKVIQDNATEAVTNTIKYAEADSVRLHVQVLNRLVKAVVSDNGKGAEKVVKGLGIKGMEERTAALGGTVIVDGSRGFSVITLLPFGKSQENSHAISP
ncbi:sensor histidine kinase [Paenibacillus caui]|uniref:sensor histidine kinase n=1 Tax=Paenibacillus caui TaxID=2873927 RepID=UPI001CA98DC2|nr:histidine kinase [Paenibacillus caui]